MTTQTRKIAVDEFWEMAADPGHRSELVDGELFEIDGAPRHGRMIGHMMMTSAGGLDLDLMPKPGPEGS